MKYACLVYSEERLVAAYSPGEPGAVSDAECRACLLYTSPSPRD